MANLSHHYLQTRPIYLLRPEFCGSKSSLGLLILASKSIWYVTKVLRNSRYEVEM
jgi:hypothetical protein